MKKILYLILPLMLLFMFASCGDKTKVSLSYSNQQIEVLVGETVNVKPTVTGDNVTVKYALSSNIATVDAAGNLTANKAGELVVTATADGHEGVEAKLIVKIKAKPSEEPSVTEYTVVLDVNGGDALENSSITFTDASKVVLPTPTKEGYKFLGWYENDTKVETLTAKNYTLVAKWEKEETPDVPVVPTYTISYNVAGGVLPANAVTSFKEGETVVLPTPTKEGCKFLGWFENDTKVETLTAKNYTLVAKWEELVGPTYTISYDVAGGVLPAGATTSFKEGETVVLPTPTKEGYKFLGWYENDTKVETLTAKNYTLVAKWEEVKTYTITWDLAGGSWDGAAGVKTFKENQTVVIPNAVRDGYIFLGWYENNVKVDKIGNKDYVLVADWYPIGTPDNPDEPDDPDTPVTPTTYTITYNVDGGVLPSGATTSFTDATKVVLPTPTKEGYKFLGWYENNSQVTTLTAKNYTLVAKWEKVETPDTPVTPTTYTITYNVDGGVLPSGATTSFTDATKVVLPTPTKSGYLFKGWYEGETLVTSLTNKNYTLVAKWEQVASGALTITYVLDSGVQLATYESRSELVAALVTDVQTIKGSTYNLSYFESATGTGYNIFAGTEGSKTFFADATMRAKWGWLISYTKGLRSAAGLDVAQYDALLTSGFVTADAASVNLEFMSFIAARQMSYEVSATTTYQSTDYTKTANNNGFWTALHQEVLKNSTFQSGATAGSVLPIASKNGAIFDGWYTSSDFAASSKLSDSTVLTSSITVYPKFVVPSGGASTVTFDYNGGVSEELFVKYGTKLTTLGVSSYNGNFWSGTNYANDVFISNSGSDPLAKFSTRIYIAKDKTTGFYTVVSILLSGAVSEWPASAEYVITISGQYAGTLDDTFSVAKIAVGNYVVFDKEISTITSASPANVAFYSGSLDKDEITVVVDSTFTVPTPTRVGYGFAGWFDDSGKQYTTVSDFLAAGSVTVTAKWSFEDQLIGSFPTKSWVAAGETVQLKAEYAGGSTGTLKWESKTPSLASVDQYGYVTGIAEGLATIVVSDATFPNINFTFYVTVFATAPTGIEKVIADSNNTSIFTKDDLPIGAGTPEYYYDVVGSVSKLLFKDYVVHKDYYLSNPSNKSTLSSGGIQFVTVHYAADMGAANSEANRQKYALTGGKNLASYNQSVSGASWHYSTGNDGVWACQNEAYGAWHAGTSKAMTWHASGVTTAKVGTDIYTTDVTLGSDGYFYLKGVKTSIKNTTGYTRLNDMGLAVKLVGSEWYIGGCYYNSSYKYISSLGGNNNSIGIETSVRIYSDLWLTWQYTAQLCAQLLLKYDLPIQRLVGHHFFSGKDCPQPMLANDLEIWYEFVELVKQEMALYQNYSSYSISAKSNSAYVNNLGRVTNLPNYSECVTYTVSYTSGGTTKTVTLSSIVPGKLA